ncbi:MAG: hypothetical protein P3X22_003410 [Thermoprotei archaeon]|nr:hypothetical protein [Thermoprotei archaeon]
MEGPSIIPILAAITSFFSLYIAIVAYRTLYPLEEVRKAVEIASEYKSISGLLRGKRAARRLKSMEPEYRKARSLILRSTIVKFALITLSYVSASLMLTIIYPVVETPYYIPLITLHVELEGREAIVMPVLYLHFFIFLYTMLLYRDLIL